MLYKVANLALAIGYGLSVYCLLLLCAHFFVRIVLWVEHLAQCFWQEVEKVITSYKMA